MSNGPVQAKAIAPSREGLPDLQEIGTVESRWHPLDEVVSYVRKRAAAGWRVDRAAVVRSARQCLLGMFGVAALTYACFHAHLEFALAWPLYLLLVVLTSLSGDVMSSAFISVLSAGSLDYFFVDPLFRFTVASPLNALALISFLITALTVTTLVSRARAEARIAKLQRERLEHLYQLAQNLLALEPEVAMGTKFLEPFEKVFGIKAVCIFDPGAGQVNMTGESRHGLADRTREAFFFSKDIDDRSAGVTVRRLRVRGQVTGAIGLEGLDDPAHTVGPLVALAATLQERTRAFRNASESAAAAQAEIYRSAVLDALAHEFKTPLATILAAAGGLRAAGPLRSEQLDMAETVEAEASRLGSLTSRLLQIARLDREDVHPRMETMSLTPLVAQTVGHYLRLPTDRRISFEDRGDGIEVVADHELLRLALSQLLDNACKYSLPGSAIAVQLERHGNIVSLRVTNSGSSIPPGERQRIFERFYRGADARRFTSGSGLGLYVARKIALAHGGLLDLDTELSTGGRVTFCLSIPAAKGEPEYAAAVG